MKGAFKFAVIGEALTGLFLEISPTLFGRLVLGVELTGVAVPVARVGGIALIALAVACLPGRGLLAMLIYSTLVTLYLGYVGLTGVFVGILLWPVVVLHGILVVLLARAWLKSREHKAT